MNKVIKNLFRYYKAGAKYLMFCLFCICIMLLGIAVFASDSLFLIIAYILVIIIPVLGKAIESED